MMDFMTNFAFVRPWFLLLALLLLGLCGWYRFGEVSESSWRRIIDKKLLDFLLIKGSSIKRKFFIWWVLVGMLLSVLIIAGPSWREVEIPAVKQYNPVVIALSLSSDMAENDLKPSRIERAKYKIKDFIDLLKGVQCALEVYSDEPFMIAPLAEDGRIAQNLLAKVSLDIMPKNGDRLDRAIDLAAQRLLEAGYTRGSLVIFTSDIGQKFDLAVEAAKKAWAQGYSVNIIGISTEHNEKLAMTAKAGGGDYWTIRNDDSKIAALADEINEQNSPYGESENQTLRREDSGWYFMVIPLLICLLLFRKGILVIVVFLYANGATAGFLTNSNQDGLKAFEQQDYAEASKSFKDSNWKGASYYRQGNYKKAYESYSLDSSVEGLYNQGNALAKSGNINEAIAKYEEVLQKDPSHEDAKFNLEYLKRQQDQQQSQQQNKSSSQNKNDDENKDNQSDNQENNDNNSDEQNGGEESGSEEQNAQEEREENSNQNQQNSDSNANENDNNSNNRQEGDMNNQGNNDTASVNSESDNDEESSDGSDPQTKQLDETQDSDAGKQSDVSAESQESGVEEDYDEQMQARMQRYREIPEDAGGLLRAFILQEYKKNRYKDE